MQLKARNATLLINQNSGLQNHFCRILYIRLLSHDRAQKAGLPIFGLGQSRDLCKAYDKFLYWRETVNEINKFCRFTDFGHYNRSQLKSLKYSPQLMI